MTGRSSDRCVSIADIQVAVLRRSIAIQENGVWQDGGLLIHFRDRQQWVAVFFAFQSQAQHTDDRTGDPISVSPTPSPTPIPSPEPDIEPTLASVKIVAALVNPAGDDLTYSPA